MLANEGDKVKALKKRYKWNKEIRDSHRLNEWKELTKFIAPAHGRYIDSKDSQPAKGAIDRSSIINSTATRARSIAVSGIKGGLTPHSLKWFKYGLFDRELEKWGPSKRWLFDAERAIYSILNRSNFYESIYMPFDEQMIFGTGPMQVHEDPRNIIWCDPWTAGEYVLAIGPNKKVDTGFRHYWSTVRNLEKKFGKENLSTHAKHMLSTNPDSYVKVINAIYPRDDYTPGKMDTFNMPSASIWWEESAPRDGSILGEGGHRSPPAMYPRWLSLAEDPYGSECPSLEVLGDVKMLQRMEKDKLAALAKVIDPPMNVPSNLYGRLKSYPGARNLTKNADRDVIRETFQVDYDIERIERSIREVENRIKEGYYNDLFLMLIGQERSGTTAYEIAKKHEEKLTLLGPVIERQNSELLNPFLGRVFDIALRKGMIPQPPKELEGQPIRVEYISILAQAQKAVGVTAIERSIGFLSSFAEAYPELRYKVDPMSVFEDYADMQGFSPHHMRSTEEAMNLYNQELQAMQAAQQPEQQATQARAAKDLSQATTEDGSSILDKITQQIPAA